MEVAANKFNPSILPPKQFLPPTEIVLEGDDFYQSLVEDLKNAQVSIDLETYIFAEDTFGAQVATALQAALARKVRVRVLVDAIGTSNLHTCLQSIEAAGASVRFFHPPPFSLTLYKRANYRHSYFQFPYFLSKINLRNHRKTCIIDEKIIYVGSANIDKRHLSQAHAGNDWRDVAVRLTGTDASDLQYAFNIAWGGVPLTARLSKRMQKINEQAIFRLNYTRHLRRKLYKSLLKAIKHATTRVWLTSAYFNPDFPLLKRLKQAAKRGVDVRIVLPNKPDLPFMKIVATTFYADLLKAGVAIYEYTPHVLHEKSLIIDNWFALGSSNMNYRSLRHDLEVDVSLQTESAKLTMEKHFETTLQHSRKISLNDLKQLTWYQKLIGYVLLMGKYFL